MRSMTRSVGPLILTVVLLAGLAAAPPASPAQVADQSLVFEAVQVLQTHYVDPVNTVKVLNAAIAGLREELSARGVTADLPEIPQYTLEADARDLFAERFVTAAAAGPLTKTQLAYAAIRGMTDSFHDSHTGFLTPEQNTERRQQQRGQAGFTGVGIVLLPKGDRFYVWTVVPRSPAEAEGVHEFDRIVKINDVPTTGLAGDQVTGMIRGPAGTSVTVTFQRPGVSDPVVIAMTRQPILVPSIIKTELLEGGVGYVRLYQFFDDAGRDVRDALIRLMDGGMRVLVLDLRGNYGGFLHELDVVLNALLPAGLPVYTEMLTGGETEIVRTTRSPLLQPTIPIVVLVNEGSASAAELLAAAIQENHRGTLVGMKTSGAVEASVVVDLSDGSALSVTSFRLATGRGVRLEGAGIEPDVTTQLTTQDLDTGIDRQLTEAIRVARQAAALLP